MRLVRLVNTKTIERKPQNDNEKWQSKRRRRSSLRNDSATFVGNAYLNKLFQAFASILENRGFPTKLYAAQKKEIPFSGRLFID